MKNRLSVLSLFILASVVAMYAQPALPSYCEAFRPSELMGSKRSLTIKQSDIDWFLKLSKYGQDKRNTMEYWEVLSDRDKNPVYESSTGSRIIGYLEWNQAVTIAEISNDRALVISGNFNKGDYPKVPLSAKCLGWVPMSKLLLWETCPTDDAGIYYKALISLNLDASNIKNNNTVGRMYGNPDNLSESAALTTDKKFYYIMKREKDMVLLATQYTVGSGYSKDVLFGWVSEGSYVPWNQRSCLEPTWEYEDVSYFINNSKSAPIYTASDEREEVTRWEYRLQKNWRDYRMNGNELRFPILDGSVKDGDGKILEYNISSFGTSTGETVKGGAIGTGESIGMTEQALREMKKINICLVIDGTESMRPYYPAVKDALKDGCELFQGKSVEIAAVIYRDREHVMGGNSYEVEEFRFTRPDNAKLMSFLDTGGEYGFRTSSDRTAEESVFYGMSRGLDMFKGKEKQSNIMLVVGDCGNNDASKDSRFTDEDIIDKLVKYNVQLMVFQIAKKSVPKAYGTFTNQLSKILKENLERKYKILDQQGVKSPSEVEMRVVEGGYVLENDKDKSNIYIGSIRFPRPEHEMAASELTKEMVTSIDNLSNTIQNQINIIIGRNTGGWHRTSGISTGMTYDEAFVRQVLGENGDPGAGVVMSFKGFTPKMDNDSRRDYYKPVLFISSDELKTLVMKLQPVADQANRPSQDRMPYINALKALIRSFVPDITPEDMENMSQNEIMDIAAGLNEASSSIKDGYSIAALGDPHKVPYAEYVSLLKQFAGKFRRLKNIQASSYPYTMEFNGAKYYWIPIEELP